MKAGGSRVCGAWLSLTVCNRGCRGRAERRTERSACFHAVKAGQFMLENRHGASAPWSRFEWFEGHPTLMETDDRAFSSEVPGPSGIRFVLPIALRELTRGSPEVAASRFSTLRE